MNLLIVLLQTFGLFWMIGGIFAFQQAQQLQVIDTAIEALSNEKQDKLFNYFLYIGSGLTFLCGLGLVVSSRWVLIPLILLIILQLVYFGIQNRRLSLAVDAEAKLDAQVNPETIRAFWVSVAVAIAVFISLGLGLLN
jgi:hypothetical protein